MLEGLTDELRHRAADARAAGDAAGGAAFDAVAKRLERVLREVQVERDYCARMVGELEWHARLWGAPGDPAAAAHRRRREALEECLGRLRG